MQTITKEIKSGGEVVSSVTIPVYDSLQEALENLGEEACLSLINTQNSTNICNTERARKTGKPSKKAVRNEALVSLTQEDPTWMATCAARCASEGLSLEEEISRIIDARFEELWDKYQGEESE